jgi:hypothetical protein
MYGNMLFHGRAAVMSFHPSERETTIEKREQNNAVF